MPNMIWLNQMKKKIFKLIFLFIIIFVFESSSANTIMAEEQAQIPDPAPTPIFSVTNALAYLKSAQATDGSFGDSPLYTDWAAIALGALNVNDDSKNLLLTYFNSHNVISSLLTDNERHAMALLALHQNPYSFNDVNYIDVIINSFDGTQFGDIDLVNDDIFALIPLKNTGYTVNDDIIIKDIAFIISKQKTDGSFEESVDLTAATIQALKLFESVVGVSETLSKASDYLANSQDSDGGWGNVSSTSWAMQAMNALSASWTKNNHTPNDYLGGQQMEDGAVLPSTETLPNRIWTTSYAIAASSLKPWNAIMQNVSKPVNQSDLDNSAVKVAQIANPQTPTNPENQSGSNNSSGSVLEIVNNPQIINPQTPPPPVVCPKGDLFSATTGKACTATLPTEAIDTSQIKSKITTTPTLKPETKKSTATTSKNLPTNPKMEKELPATLTATAVNALPNKTIPYNTIPIALGILSGIILLLLVL